jgi:multiple sugar transport system substrate-binding protein
MNRNLLVFGSAAILIIIVIGIALYFFAGNKNNGQQEEEKITLVYWGLWEPDSVMKSVIDQYEEDHSNIDIQYVQKPFTQYEANAYTRIAQNEISDTPAPDIIRMNNGWLTKFQPYLAPLPSSVMNASEYAANFYPTAVDDFTGTDGNLYAIPIEVDGLALFYNKKLFNDADIAEPPADWDELIADAKKLTKTKSNGDITQAGAALGTAKNIKHSTDIFSLLLMQNGVEVTNSDNTQVTLTSTRAQSAMEFYTNFISVHKTWSPDLATDLEVFYSGKLAMMFAPSWRAFDVINSAPSVEFGIAPVPQLPGNDPVNYSMYWGEAVAKTSTNQQAAWEFIKYLSEPTQQRALFSNASQIRAFGEPYSRVSMASELEANPYAAAFVKMAPTMKAWKFVGDQSFVEESIRTAINDVAEGGVDILQALRDAEERINNPSGETE